MKKSYPYLTITAIAVLSITSICSAQTISLKQAPAKVTIDGSLAEWGDSLNYYNSETQLNYTLANDKDNLYLVLKTNDPMEQERILAWGLTFSIDTKGRKKSTYSVNYPMPEQGDGGFGKHGEDKKLEASLTKLKKLKADGFKDVEFDVITLENTYGFRAAINYDTHGFLVYEEAIPLALFHADDVKKSEWGFDIKINGPDRPAKREGEEQPENAGADGRGGGGGGRRGGGMGGAGGDMGVGGRGGRGRTEGATNQNTNSASKPVDFWGKFTLAKAQ